MERNDHVLSLPDDTFEHGLFIVAALLMGLGIVMVYSATVHASLTPEGNTAYLLNQVRHVSLGLAVLFVGIFVPLRWVRRFSLPLLLVGAGLMIALVFWGQSANNSVRWIELGTRFQPGEFVKLFFLIWVAHHLAGKGDKIKSFSLGMLPYLVVASPFLGLYLWQPDLGSSIILVLLLLAVLIAAGARWTYVVWVLGVGAILGLLVILDSPTKIQRIMAFLYPDAPQYRVGAAYQTNQSLVGLASNGLWGAGLGSGRQSIAGNLPESQTDFIFSVIGEELGFPGVVLVAACFLYILYRGTVIASRSRDAFHRYLAFGATALVVSQAAINMAVNCKLMPTKGLPMPFLAAGGSNLVTMCAAMGLLLNISRSLVSTEPTRASGAPVAADAATLEADVRVQPRRVP